MSRVLRECLGEGHYKEKEQHVQRPASAVMTSSSNDENFSVPRAKNARGWPRAESGWTKMRPER